jgi:hypothetical protein
MLREASMLVRREWMLLAVLFTAPMTAATGNVITDWDEKAMALVQPGTVFPPPTALRTTAMLHLAMFEAVNSIELLTAAMLDGCSITRQWSPFKADGVQLVNLGNIAAYVVARIFLAQPLGHASGEFQLR